MTVSAGADDISRAVLEDYGWASGLPPDAMIFPGEQPPPTELLPRALAGHVMVQVEQPANLAYWENPAYWLVTLILIRCGLRVSDALQLPSGCVTADDADALYLCYFNHKMKREALVPLDDELPTLILICLSSISRLLPRVSGRDAHQVPSLRGQRSGTLMCWTPRSADARFGNDPMYLLKDWGFAVIRMAALDTGTRGDDLHPGRAPAR